MRQLINDFAQWLNKKSYTPPRVEYYSHIPGMEKWAPVQPTSRFIPSWYKNLPVQATEDTEQIKITEKNTNVTQQGITSKVTTAKDAVVTTTSGGKSKNISRKNFSQNGFVTKQVYITEYITEVTKGSDNISFNLSYKPIRSKFIKGFDPAGLKGRGGTKLIVTPPSRRLDTFTIKGKEVTINTNIGVSYDEFPASKKFPKGTMFIIRYYTLSNYDPDYKPDTIELADEDGTLI